MAMAFAAEKNKIGKKKLKKDTNSKELSGLGRMGSTLI